MPLRSLAVLFLACALAACEAAPSAAPDVAAADVPAATDAVVDAQLPDLPSLDTDEPQCPGAAGCNCAGDSDCSSGICAETPLGPRCATLCGTGCPTGTTCKTFSGSGDPILYCAPVGVRQCAPCKSSQDCVGAWGAAAVCASAGSAGSFCASVCQVGADCPAGSQCVSVDGTAGKVCTPAEGLAACTCSTWAKSAAAGTSCLVVTGTEACPGTRSCGTAGLSDCTKLSGEACFDLGCKDATDGSPCDDGDPCTQSECKAGVCTATDTDLCECQTTADCPDDTNLCNGKPFCDKSVTPYVCKVNPASVVTCTKPDNPCDESTCQPDSGTCLTTTVADNTPCDDGKACTTGDVCTAGKCVSGTVTCTCAQDADCQPFEDGNLCNGTLFCNKAKGQCQVNPKTVVACATGLDTTCQQTVCEPASGACVLSQAATSTLCDDGNPCSASDHCEAGKCTSTVDICPCEQDSECASSEDNNLCNGTLYCDLGSHVCRINPATVVSCPIDSGNACSPMECQPATGQCQPSALLTGTCDDDNPCTALGTCSAGQCVPGPEVCQCQTSQDCAVFDDGNPCNGTFFCDAQSGTCKANLAEVPICPPAADACSANVCDPTSGACKLVAAKNGTWCSDGEACTKNDQCQSGACVAGVSVCACIHDSDCAGQDDGDPCNGWFFCDKTDGAPQCVFNSQPQAGCVDVIDGADASDGADATGGETLDDATEDTAADGSDDSADGEQDAAADGDAAGESDDVATAPTCTDPGDLAIEIDDDGTKKLICAHDYPAWGLVSLSPNSLTPQADLTVLDTKTGLQWQRDPAGWNSGLLTASSLDWQNAIGYCDDLVLGGHEDWYLPTAGELLSIVDYLDTNPPVIAAPLESPQNSNYWSSTPSAAAPENEAWMVQSLHGFISTGTVGTPWLVRCVRQATAVVPAVAPEARWEPGGDLPPDAVADRLTRLAWQRAPAAVSLGAGGELQWSQAADYCETLLLSGQGGWRLPEVNELLSLIDRKQEPPAVATELLSAAGSSSGLFWTQTAMAAGVDEHWGVHFDAGGAYNLQDAWLAGVRCVRPMVCGDGLCDPDEPGVCFADCGCKGVEEGGACDDANPCSEADVCNQGTCSGTAKTCEDGLPNTTGYCSPDNGQCYQSWAEICNGKDDDLDGTIDNVGCGGQSCTCQNGVAVCAVACTTCPDPGDRAIPIDDAGQPKVVCAHDYPAWGIAPDLVTTYNDPQDGTIVDTQTGLQWQKDIDASFKVHGAALTYCDGLVLAGFADWRLPTITELESIVDYSTEVNPPVVLPHFAGTWNSAHWTVTPLLGDPSYLWDVYFALGTSGAVPKSAANTVVRCVRNAAPLATKPPAQRWHVGLETTTDLALGRVWQRVVPTAGSGTNSHAAALSYCADLTLGGSEAWRLPTIRELRSLVDLSGTGHPAIPPVLVTQPDAGSQFWSASLRGGSATEAWALSNYNGYIESKAVGDAFRTVCVRDVACGDAQCDAGEEATCFADCGCTSSTVTPALHKTFVHHVATDLLIVVDNSASMGDEQTSLQASSTALLTELSNYGLDFHVGVITTDMEDAAQSGRLRMNSGYAGLSTSTPDASTVLSAMVGVGTTGSANEEGLAAALAALTAPLTDDGKTSCVQDATCTTPQICVADIDNVATKACGGPNRTFRRPTASLDVLFLSDEEDQSAQSVSWYNSEFAALVDANAAGGFAAHAIVGPATSGCTWAGGDANPSARYLALASATGGVMASICAASYTAPIQSVVAKIRARQLKFPFGVAVVPESIQVVADGVPCLAGSWVYDPVAHAVAIDPDGTCSVSPGDNVEISANADCSATP